MKLGFLIFHTMSTTSSAPVPIAQFSVSIPGIEVERVASQIKE